MPGCPAVVLIRGDDRFIPGGNIDIESRLLGTVRRSTAGGHDSRDAHCNAHAWAAAWVVRQPRHPFHVLRPRQPAELDSHLGRLVRPQAREECRHTLILAKHDAAFFGGVRVRGRARHQKSPGSGGR